MKPLREVAGAYAALGKAERELGEGLFEAAALSCRNAMDVSRTVPAEEVFDHAGFDAFCHAWLSRALGELGRFDESLAAAELSIGYFSRRGELQEEAGKMWITAVMQRALAFDALGRQEEALVELQKGVEMLQERKGEMAQKEAYLREASLRIARLEDFQKQAKPSGYKAWWEFWS